VPPKLFVDGALPAQRGLLRVMSLQDGYRGYSNGLESGMSFQFLGTPQATFRVPPHSYFALGDNSYHSSDSRNWGVVPEVNASGRALAVYWPFPRRWGLID
jgi:signal peptidase I